MGTPGAPVVGEGVATGSSVGWFVIPDGGSVVPAVVGEGVIGDV